MIKPELIGLEEEDRWQEVDNAPFGTDPNIRWFIEYQVGLRNTTPKKRFFNKDDTSLYLGYVSTTVCSPAFKDSPPSDYSPAKIERAFVQTAFDQSKVEKFISDKLQKITASDQNELAEVLSGFLAIDG